MRAVFTYSHLGGEELLMVRYPDTLEAVREAIAGAVGDFRTKRSRERGSEGKMLYDPGAINGALAEQFQARGFRELRRAVEPDVPGWDTQGMRAGSKQIDFAKGRVLVEVQLGKYFAMFYDMAKLEYFYRRDEADAGVEIVPSFRMAAEMSSGVGRGEMLVTDIRALQRQFPAFPVMIIFIEPEDLRA